MKFERTKIYNIREALYGMRLPMMSHDKSDSYYHFSSDEDIANGCECSSKYVIGPNDLKLCQKLIKAGSEHRKFMRQIMISVTITAPLYWWKEFDTYKVGTVANSSSTMHKLASTPITLDCFETDDYNPGLSMCESDEEDCIEDTLIHALENIRLMYLETKDKRYWKELIRWLPCGWLQTRTITMNYENLRSMYFQRKSHKLSEWHQFCSWIESLPYAKELIMYTGDEKDE